jgi:hypothetical protein
MNIFVHMPNNGKYLTLAMTRESTVGDVKTSIATEENIDTKYQKLQFCENFLNDDSSQLIDLNICAASTLTLTVEVSVQEIYDEIISVKQENEAMVTQIQAIVEVTKLSYFAEFVVDEDGVPSCRAVEEEKKVAASAIIDEFALECNFHRKKDSINYDITTVTELVDMNRAMFVPVQYLVGLFPEGSEQIRAVLLEYRDNYCTIFRNLTRLLRMELVDDVSKQADLDIHAAAVAAQFQQMGAKGLMFKRKTPPSLKDSAIAADCAIVPLSTMRTLHPLDIISSSAESVETCVESVAALNACFSHLAALKPLSIRRNRLGGAERARTVSSSLSYTSSPQTPPNTFDIHASYSLLRTHITTTRGISACRPAAPPSAPLPPLSVLLPLNIANLVSRINETGCVEPVQLSRGQTAQQLGSQKSGIDSMLCPAPTSILLSATRPSTPTRSEAVTGVAYVKESPQRVLSRIFDIQGLHLSPKYVEDAANKIAEILKKPKELSGDVVFSCFISYRVEADGGIAEHLYDKFRSRGFTVYLDKYCLEIGKPWKSEFIRDLTRSRVFIPVMSSKGLAPLKDTTRNHSNDNLLLEYQIALDRLDTIGDTQFGIYPVLVGTKVDQHTFEEFHDFSGYSDSLFPVVSQ